MSRATRNINRITEDIDRISGLDGIVADKVEKLPDEDHKMLDDIKKSHSEVSIFDYDRYTCADCDWENGEGGCTVPSYPYETEL